LADKTFDVFLSHNSLDKPAVMEIAVTLRDERNLDVWLDAWDLQPGRPWQDGLEAVIKTARSAAIFVGKDGLGPWEIPEMRACLNEMVRRKVPVIPVLLPGAPKSPEIPVFLAQNTWVDLRHGITEEGLDSLQWGITDKKPISRPAQRQPSSPTPPRRHNLPFASLGDLFKGRDAELRTLSDGPATAITQAQTLFGLGGIGKTRLAVEHAWLSGDRYDTVLFVVADSPQALRSGLAQLARPDLLNLPEHEEASEESSIAAVLRWLREHDRWLVILDNVDTKEAEKAVLDLLPSFSNGRVLITSRLREWPPSVRRQPLETLSPAEAQRFLLERTAADRSRSADDAEAASRLAETLGNLPLALEQAAAYIVHHQMSLSGYLDDWQRERETVLHWYDGAVMQYPAPIAVTWQTTFRQLSPTAATVLRLTAYLAPEPIPVEMFEAEAAIVEEAVGAFCEEHGATPGDSSIKPALAELASFSLVTREGASLTVHRMVQEVLRSSITGERRRGWIERSLQLVNEFSPDTPSDVRTWPVWDRLRPHAAAVVQHADTASIASATACLMAQLSLLLKTKSLYTEAEPLIRRALKINEDSLGPGHSDVAVCLNNLAQLLEATNRLDEAEPLMRRALQIAEESFGARHPKVAIRLGNLGALLKETNRLEEAEPLIRRALQIFEESFGPRHPNVATGLSNLAQLLQDTNRLEEAEPLMRRTLLINEESFGPRHPEVATDLSNLASLLRATHRLDEAEFLLRRALEIREQSLGSEHPKTHLARRKLNLLIQERQDPS
jgi:tetratricopeptide (TPR) repeat protein